MNTQTAPKNAKNTASRSEEAFEDFGGDQEQKLSLPIFAPSQCKGPFAAVLFNILGPFPAAKDSVNQDPWCAYEGVLTAPCDLLEDGNVKVFPAGTKCMIGAGAQLRKLAPYVVGDTVYRHTLTVGPQPKPGKMRTWSYARSEKSVPRGSKYQLVSSKEDAKQLMAGRVSDAEIVADDMP